MRVFFDVTNNFFIRLSRCFTLYLMAIFTVKPLMLNKTSVLSEKRYVKIPHFIVRKIELSYNIRVISRL